MQEIGLDNLFRKRDGVESRSITAENPDGRRGGGALADPRGEGPARDLGVGWKVRPCITLKAGETATIMDVAGSGVIRHIWFTFNNRFYRSVVVRFFWDGQEHPSVQAPLGDFLCNSWNQRQNILAHPVNVNPVGGMNIFFPMPFRKHARITVENLAPLDLEGFFYAVNYTLEQVGPDALSFHAHWRRSNPLAYRSEYLLVDAIRGQGQYVGTFMAWQQNIDRLVGRGRDQDVPGRRRAESHDLRHGHRGLLRRCVGVRAGELQRSVLRLPAGFGPIGGSRVPHDAVPLPRLRPGVLQQPARR